MNTDKTICITTLSLALLGGLATPEVRANADGVGMRKATLMEQETRHYPSFDQQQEQVVFTVEDPAAALRQYRQTTSARLRDAAPAPESGSASASASATAGSSARYTELEDLPRVRSGSVAFDALFALANAEMRQNSVSQIRDGSYSAGQAIACDCFETGEKWNYVWTRDLSYAAHLGLALLDPQRVKKSLEFKLSGYRSGIAKPLAAAGTSDGIQIIQDTGSGGSWPVSTDRVSWAFGADAVLATLLGAERQRFATQALQALSNTLDNDRLAAFDAADGLYRGEQSFLDWREQSYAPWIVNDIASLATSKALSTNVAHFQALQLGAQLAQEQGQAEVAQRYSAWAAALKIAINARFWQADRGLYSSIIAGHFDGAATYKYDWLGQSLAIVTGVANGAQTRQILANYPHGPFGAPVIFPQQPNVAIYHNRALWPFVTAYGLQAAIIGRNVSVADAAYASLLRGAALNLSNMENYEWLSGQAAWHDAAHADLDGPVVNSKRQLWSVGAYLGMVINQVFGVQANEAGLQLRPFITAKLRREAFAKSATITLHNLRLHGKTIQLVIHLPPVSKANGVYALGRVALNGKPVGAQLRWEEMPATTRLELHLGALQAGEQGMRSVSAAPSARLGSDAASRTVFAPVEASLATRGIDAQGKLALTIVDPHNPPEHTRYRLYRNGQLIASELNVGTWQANLKADDAGGCYTVEASFGDSGNRSHHSVPLCVLDKNDHEEWIAAQDSRMVASRELHAPDALHTQAYYAGWGQPSDTLAVHQIQLPRDGVLHLQWGYHNQQHAINLGITSGVKWLSLHDAAGRIVAQQVVVLPHANTGPAYSTPLTVAVKAGVYSVQLQDFSNMSYLKNNASYADAGGVKGAVNWVDIAGLRVRLFVQP